MWMKLATVALQLMFWMSYQNLVRSSDRADVWDTVQMDVAGFHLIVIQSFRTFPEAEKGPKSFPNGVAIALSLSLK